MARKQVRKYPPGLLCEPFEWQFESEEEYAKRTSTSPNSELDSSSDNFAYTITYLMTRQQSNNSNLRYSRIVSELHKFYGTKESDWEALAKALIEHHVPAFSRGQPGRSKTHHEKHLKVLQAYAAAKVQLLGSGSTKDASTRKVPKKTIHDLAGRILNQTQSQFKENLREAKKWLNSEGSAWQSLLEFDLR